MIKKLLLCVVWLLIIAASAGTLLVALAAYDSALVKGIEPEVWKKIAAALPLLLALTAVGFVLVQHYLFTVPVRRITRWFSDFQKGNTQELRPYTEGGELGKFAGEVEQIALSLRVAQRAAAKKSSEYIQKTDAWTESKLRELVFAKLKGNPLVVVSNREPYTHVPVPPGAKPKCIRPASGVVTAIDPILYACGGTWIAQGSTEEDKRFVNSKNKLGVPVDDMHYILKRVWLTKEEEDGYYYGFANEGLWPLCHFTHTRPIFKEADWQMYKQANRKFAESVLEELTVKPPFIFIQDYHFTLLAKYIKEKRPDATIALFWHIPWPSPEAFAICPYQMEILDGMLASDLIGFHLQYHCNNFLETANRLIECRVDAEKFSVVRDQKETFVKAFPISVADGADSAPDATAAQMIKISQDLKLKDKKIAVGVDRIDYTKGINERILAIDRFLEKYPQYKAKFVFIQLASPSRTHIPRYQELVDEIDALVAKTNAKYAEPGWRPIIYLKRQFSQDEIKPYYQIADLCIVSALHDGMNLVAKEFVASRKDLNGTLILSRFTGASRELHDAVLINPYAIEDFADAIKSSLEMAPEEKKKRMESMRKAVAENNVYRWAGSIITELAAIHGLSI